MKTTNELIRYALENTALTDPMQNTDTTPLGYVGFGFAEGALSIAGVKAYTWHAANAMLAGIQAANPETIIAGAYVKVDVTVYWADGESYAFRYAVDHNAVNLAQRVLDGLKYVADTVAAFVQGRDFNGLNY